MDCGSCHRVFSSTLLPYILPCNHVFCSDCVSRLKGSCGKCIKPFLPYQVKANDTLMQILEIKGQLSPQKEVCPSHRRDLTHYCIKCFKVMCMQCQCPHTGETKTIIPEHTLFKTADLIVNDYAALDSHTKKLCDLIDAVH